MDKFIFVTGLHRAGTHTTAKEKAKELGLLYIEESMIGLDNLERTKKLLDSDNLKYEDWKLFGKLCFSDDGFKILQNSILEKFEEFRRQLKNGFVLQCPFLAHKTLELAKLGKVYWATRNFDHVVTSMTNINFIVQAREIRDSFRNEFPDDEIWNKLIYQSKNDPQCFFPKFNSLVVFIKEYFYNTKFKNIAEKIILEEQLFYDFESTITKLRPIKTMAKKLLEEAKIYHGSLCLY